jgi:raffinose/stachyose/melibiose transport system permease protein
MNFPMILVRAIQDGNYGYANVSAVIMILVGLVTLWLVNKLFRMHESVY